VLDLLLVEHTLTGNGLAGERSHEEDEEEERQAVVPHPEPHRRLEVRDADGRVEREAGKDDEQIDREHRAHAQA
jgi:hypothetical protein